MPYEDAAVAVVARLDALLLSGGADVSPERYGQDPQEHTRWREDRDAWELALLWAVDEVRRPVLGVCRGMQLMAVHAGGALVQHVPDLIGHERHKPGGDTFGETAVTVKPGSRLGTLLPPELTVNCHHHQSVRTHPGFVDSAWADDGLLEAMEAPGQRWCVAVQWHPEVAADAGLFRGLVAAAGKAAGL
jgi:putative glutamine amidotransferase